MSDPTMMTGSFELDGWTFEKFEPANDQEAHVCMIVATNGDRVVRRLVDMDYPNLFGMDVADVQAVNEAVERMIVELGIDG